MNAEKLAKMQAQVRTGGKGTARRKKKVVHKTAATDDKKLQVGIRIFTNRKPEGRIPHTGVMYRY